MQGEKTAMATGNTSNQEEKPESSQDHRERYLAEITEKYRKMDFVEIESRINEITGYLLDFMRIFPLALGNEEYEGLSTPPSWIFYDAEEKVVILDILHSEIAHRMFEKRRT